MHGGARTPPSLQGYLDTFTPEEASDQGHDMAAIGTTAKHFASIRRRGTSANAHHGRGGAPGYRHIDMDRGDDDTLPGGRHKVVDGCAAPQDVPPWVWVRR